MSISIGLVEIGILILTIFALSGVLLAFLLPTRIRPADIGTSPEVREAFRSNLIQTLTVLLVVIGAAVALKQLAASLDQLQEDRLGLLADEVETAETRLVSPDSDEQSRVDAIADLARLHAKSPEHRFRIERDLLRYVQSHARQTDVSTLSAPSAPPHDVQLALSFLLTKGQEQREPDWEMLGEGTGLALANLDLRGIDLRGTTLIGADLSHTLLSGADLREARMDGTLLINAGLQDAKLQRAVLRGSILSDAYLENASLTETNLAEADLRGVQGLTWAQVRDAALTCSTQLPSMLPLANTDRGTQVPMMLVLRDCLLPHEVQIPANVLSLVRFSTVLPAEVVVRVPELRIDTRVPDRTRVATVTVLPDPGRFSVMAEADQGATHIEGTLISVEDSSGVTPTVMPTARVPTPTRETAVTPTVLVTVQSTALAQENGGWGIGITDNIDALDCDPSYPDFCIPSPPPYLACGDIPYSRFTVLPPDPHSFDRDFNGIGCEPVFANPTVLPRPTRVEQSTPIPTRTPPPPSPVSVQADEVDRDCADFASQAEAQAFFEAAGGPEIDLHRLDNDGDGTACSIITGAIPDLTVVP